MCDTGCVDDPAEPQLDVVGAEVVEKTAALPEQHRNLVNLQLVEDAGGHELVETSPLAPDGRDPAGPPPSDSQSCRRPSPPSGLSWSSSSAVMKPSRDMDM